MESFSHKITEKSIQRFMAKIVPDTESGCWYWGGAINNKGYGHLRACGEWWLAHRFIYTYHHGPIPPNRIIRHTCNNTSCVNPDHLLIGTPQENVCDQIESGSFKPRHGRLKYPLEYYRNRDDRYK